MFHTNNTNLENPREPPFGPHSSDRNHNSDTFTNTLNPPFTEISNHLPDSFSKPNPSKSATNYSYDPFSHICPNLKNTDSTNSNQDKLFSNQIANITKETNVISLHSSDTDYSDNEIDAHPKDIHVNGSEIILIVDISEEIFLFLQVSPFPSFSTNKMFLLLKVFYLLAIISSY